MEHSAGFTIIELMVTVAVVGILLAIGIPSFQWLIGNNRLAAQTNDLVSALSIARTEALKRGRPVTICRSSSATQAEPACGGGNGWEDGWVIFVDPDRDGELKEADADLDADGVVDANEDTNGSGSHEIADVLIQVHGPLRSNTLRRNGLFPDHVTVNQRGMASTGTFLLCDAGRKTYARGVRVARTGRTSVDKYDGNYTNQVTGLACPP